jgi:glycosyltransferase involved in cell wall biosynthesis
MKILYHHRVASKDGQYVHIEEIVASLRKLGHEVVICEPDSIGRTEFGGASSLVDTLRARLPGFVHELAEWLYSIPDYLKLRRLIREHRPDCIYERYNLLFSSGIWASRRFGLPILMEVNAPLYAERLANNGLSLRRLARWSEDYAWRSADHVLPVTRVLADTVVDRGVPEERITVIPNGINADFARGLPGPGIADQRYGLVGKLVLGFTGFVRDWHRLDRVLSAIAAHPEQNWQLMLVGDGPDRPRLERIAGELGIADRLTVTGIVGREQMPGLVQRFDVALQPDVVPYASPLKMFEYLALGKAILAPDSANIREILRDGDNALLFRQDDESFTRQLLRLCSDESLRGRLGESARASVERQGLYWDNNARTITGLFEALLSAGRATGEAAS